MAAGELLEHVGSNSLTRDGIQAPSLGTRSLSHWTTRDVLIKNILIYWHITYFFPLSILSSTHHIFEYISKLHLLPLNFSASILLRVELYPLKKDTVKF